jgi:regulator of protease activity HflC (stomatin/prohibitin superfamily)
MRRRSARRAGTLVLAVMVIGLIALVSGAKVARQPVGYVGVVRNGGPLDRRTIRQVLLPGQGLTWIGLYSEAPHEYPAHAVSRTYTVTSDPRRGSRVGVDVLTVPTKDGVQVGVEATIFVRFVGESSIPTLEQFDVSFGSRRFPAPDGRRLFPWEGDDGFYAWLNALFRPVLDYDVRKEIGRFECAELVASCSLVSRGAGLRPVPLANADDIAKRLSKTLQHDLTRTIGERYLDDIRVRIARVVLPAEVQAAIDRAQAQFASVNTARAQLQQAEYTAKRNRLLGESYNRSPALASIDALKAIPKGSTVIVSTGGRSPTVFAGAGGAAGALSGAGAQAGGGDATDSGSGAGGSSAGADASSGSDAGG